MEVRSLSLRCNRMRGPNLFATRVKQVRANDVVEEKSLHKRLALSQKPRAVGESLEYLTAM